MVEGIGDEAEREILKKRKETKILIKG